MAITNLFFKNKTMYYTQKIILETKEIVNSGGNQEFNIK